MEIINPNCAVAYQPCRFSTGPGIVFTPLDQSFNGSTIILYHGWGSTMIRQLFRGQIFASWGYRVVIPELLHHGERGALFYEDAKTALAHFWEVVEHSADEFPALKSEIVSQFSVDPSKIAVVGHSMGGFIVTALMGMYKDIAAGVAFNAGTDWAVMNRKMASLLNTSLEALETECEFEGCRIYRNRFNPLDRVETYRGRPLLLTNGGKDATVPPEGNDVFVARARAASDAGAWCSYIRYEEIGHHVTDGMLYDGLSFLKRFL